MENAKKNAAYAAVDAVLASGNIRVVGIGSGSTIIYCVKRLAYHVAQKTLEVKACIPTSYQAKQLIIEMELPLADLDQYPILDVAFDGTDKIDSNLNCIKGGGGCLLQEKIVSFAAKRFVVVADASKETDSIFHTQVSLPIEVVPMAATVVMKQLKLLGHNRTTIRTGSGKMGPVVTDNGNFIIDIDLDGFDENLEQQLLNIPGICETGLFLFNNRPHEAYIGQKDDNTKPVWRSQQKGAYGGIPP